MSDSQESSLRFAPPFPRPRATLAGGLACATGGRRAGLGPGAGAGKKKKKKEKKEKKEKRKKRRRKKKRRGKKEEERIWSVGLCTAFFFYSNKGIPFSRGIPLFMGKPLGKGGVVA